MKGCEYGTWMVMFAGFPGCFTNGANFVPDDDDDEGSLDGGKAVDALLGWSVVKVETLISPSLAFRKALLTLAPVLTRNLRMSSMPPISFNSQLDSIVYKLPLG